MTRHIIEKKTEQHETEILQKRTLRRLITEQGERK